ncbi:hypothetical protein PVAND_001730 [Polypedilum vanderplanki]|uniref:Galectin n=1 Tax=Polypedilum vanderplanki TaxID=319348 RepID=A0A9J6BNT1_POLVA|nr:hypothetical protein PVAND_001730 [Polypedilum vanderplanki]
MQKYNGRLMPVEAGQLITIVGKLLPNPQRFDVELLTGNNQGNDAGDIQLHLSTRFQIAEPVVVRNSHTRGIGWNQEERRENLFPHNSLNPFRRGGLFKIAIFIDRAAFFISINDKPFCTFNHRLPLNAIQRINIARDVEEIYQVNQTTVQEQQLVWPGINPNVFESFAPRQFNPGNVILITGCPRGNSNGDFTINFFDGAKLDITHLHFRTYFSRHNIILNSQHENGHWQQEISTQLQPYPFAIGQVFKIAIAITSTDFQIAVNGKKVAFMTFREHQKRLLGSLTGFQLLSNNGLNVLVQGVDHLLMDSSCSGFERYSS